MSQLGNLVVGTIPKGMGFDPEEVKRSAVKGWLGGENLIGRPDVYQA